MIMTSPQACIPTRSGQWGARTKFHPRKKGSEDSRVVRNFIPINKYTIKSSYLVHRPEEVLDTIIKPGFDVNFTADALYGFWAMPMKESDSNKTGFVNLMALGFISVWVKDLKTLLIPPLSFLILFLDLCLLIETSLSPGKTKL